MLAREQNNSPLTELFRRGTRLSYKKGEFIIRPGESPPGVFFIEEGLVKAYDITKYGEENMLIIRRNGEIFPLIWGVTGKERDIIYEAMAPTTVWRITHEEFKSTIEKDIPLLHILLEMSIEMYRLHSERIINLEYRSVRERLISFLLMQEKRFGQKKSNGTLIAIQLRQQDIASSINASRETTSRELSGLERSGLIANDQGYITIIDKNKLKKYL